MLSSGCSLRCRVAGVIFRYRLAVYFEVSCSRGHFYVSSSGCIIKCCVTWVIFRCHLSVYFEVSCSRFIFRCRLSGVF